jgi:hypothetical protein
MGPIRETSTSGELGSDAKPELIPAAVFWAELERCGVGLTNKYTKNGKQRFCTQKDGECFLVSVHEQYPLSMVDKVLFENGFFAVPLYTNRN